MRINRLISLSIAAGMFMPVAASAAFSDVPSLHPNADAIAYVKAEGIVEGYADGTFKPDQTINRAEFTKIILIAIGGDSDCSTSAFRDVPLRTWFAPYVCGAKAHRLIDGYPDGTFRPSVNINFAESAKIITQAFDMTNNPTDIWYEGYVRALADAKAIPTSISSFDKNITRGEMAEMIYRLKAGATDKPSKSYDDLAEQWFTYESDADDFTIALPPGTKVEEQMGGNDHYYSIKSPDLDLFIKVDQVPDNTLAVYNLLGELPLQTFPIKGSLTAYYKDENGYCDAGSCGEPNVSYARSAGGKIYVLTFTGDTKETAIESKVFDSFYLMETPAIPVADMLFYENIDEAYGMNYPRVWTIKENDRTVTEFETYEGGTGFYANPGSFFEEAKMHVAHSQTCPDLPDGGSPVLITNEEFNAGYWYHHANEGDAYMAYEGDIYALKISPTNCLLFITSRKYKTQPSGNISDWSKRQEQERGRLNGIFWQMIMSFKIF
jgi:hypothetical protein